MSSEPSSSSGFRLRDAELSDASEILAIYAPFVKDSLTSFEYDVPTEADIKRRIQYIQENFPWIICETADGTVAGYAYASKFRDREAYQWVAETAIYVSQTFRGQGGVGTILYKKLCEILKEQGYYQALGIVSADNPASFKFHEKLGFKYAGEFKNCGNKFGEWCDVRWFSKPLRELQNNPEKPKKYSEIQNRISLN